MSAFDNPPHIEPRRLGLHHIAMFRGHLKGLTVKEIATSYLPARTDLRLARAEIAWIRGELISLANRSGFSVERALLLRSAARISARTDGSVPAPPPRGQSAVPTLDEFRVRHGDFYTEAELIERYAEEYPSPGASRRRRSPDELRSHLIDRQVAAVNRLASRLGAPPSITDGTHAWLPSRVADRLRSAGVYSLADIYRCVQRRGRTWYRLVPKLGPRGAEAIEHWWGHYRATLGPLPEALKEIGTKPQQNLSLLDYALEATNHGASAGGNPSTALDAVGLGSGGPQSAAVRPILAIWRRLPRCLRGYPHEERKQVSDSIADYDDLSAVVDWLRAKRNASQATLRSYAREAERLLLWSTLERGTALSKLTAGDLATYVAFLQSPEPRARWVGERKAPASTPDWRPFVDGLSDASAELACRILESMFSHLVELGYLERNAWTGVSVAFKIESGSLIERQLSTGAWTAVTQRAIAPSQSPLRARDAFIVRFLYATGLRLAELRTLRLRDIRWDSHSEAWVLSILGKGKKVREVPIAPDTALMLSTYLLGSRTTVLLTGTAVDLSTTLRSLPANDYVVARLPDERFGKPTASSSQHPSSSTSLEEGPVSASTIYRACKRFFRDAAELPNELSAEERESLFSASTHWLRHTFASHGLQDGFELLVLRDILGHASIATTNRYVHTELRARADAIKRIAARRIVRSR